MKKKRVLLASIVLMAAIIIFTAGMIIAGPVTPDKIEVVTPRYTPEPGTFEPHLGTYTYDVTWQGIPAGILELNLEKTDTDYLIRAGARTNRFIDFFYKLRFNTEALIASDTLHPKTSVYDSRANKRHEKTTIEFLPDGKINSRHVNRRGRVEAYLFKTDNLTLDPFSAVFLALSLPWEVGDTRRFDTFTGKSRYLIELTAIDKTIIHVTGIDREAIVVSPKVFKLNKKASDNDDRLREVRIYISNEPSREILKLESDVFVGTVNSLMVSFTPSESITEDAGTPDM